MKFSFRISKWANFFFFVSNLSQWHFSCLPEYNKIWLSKTGPLNLQEKGTLKKLKKTLRKYGFVNQKGVTTWLMVPFIASAENRVWQEVASWVKRSEYEQIKKIFNLFEKRFEKIWPKEKIKLQLFKKSLLKELSSRNFKKALSKLMMFLDKNRFSDKTITLYLLASPKGSLGIGGGALPGRNGITLEVRDLKSYKEYAQIVLHEIGHLFCDQKIRKKIQKELKKIDLPSNNITRQRGRVALVEELVLCSFVPNGYLAKRYFRGSLPKLAKDKEERQGEWQSLEKFATFHLYPLAKSYIESNRFLDQRFLAGAIKVVKEFFKSKNQRIINKKEPRINPRLLRF